MDACHCCFASSCSAPRPRNQRATSRRSPSTPKRASTSRPRTPRCSSSSPPTTAGSISSATAAAARLPKLPTRLNRQDEFYPPGRRRVHRRAGAAGRARATGTRRRTSSTSSTRRRTIDDNVSLTRIELKDAHYPLHRHALPARRTTTQDVIEQWTEIRHDEAKPVRLDRYHSAAPVLRGEGVPPHASSRATTSARRRSSRKSSRRG